LSPDWGKFDRIGQEINQHLPHAALIHGNASQVFGNSTAEPNLFLKRLLFDKY
jgi:hypothetical protein